MGPYSHSGMLTVRALAKRGSLLAIPTTASRTPHSTTSTKAHTHLHPTFALWTAASLPARCASATWTSSSLLPTRELLLCVSS